jgi:hypothetical protein
MWQNILHINKEYFTMSHKVNPYGMKIFVKYFIMWHGICYKDFLLLTWACSLAYRSLLDAWPLASSLKGVIFQIESYIGLPQGMKLILNHHSFNVKLSFMHLFLPSWMPLKPIDNGYGMGLKPNGCWNLCILSWIHAFMPIGGWSSKWEVKVKHNQVSPYGLE